jgi:hypothetical protein
MLQPLDLIDIGVLYDCIAIPVLSTQTQEQLLGHLSSVSRRYSVLHEFSQFGLILWKLSKKKSNNRGQISLWPKKDSYRRAANGFAS